MFFGNQTFDPRLNVQWLRQNISLVSQMPVLFPKTIRENIAMGKKDATDAEIIAAAKMVCRLKCPFEHMWKWHGGNKRET